MSHVTSYIWHLTHEMCHVTHRRRWTLSPNVRSLALTVCDSWYFDYLEEKDDWNNWINGWQRCLYNCPGYAGSNNYVVLFWHHSMGPQQIKKTNISKALILYFLTKKRPAQEGRTDRRICRDRLPRCTYWSKGSTLHLLFIALASLLSSAKVLVLNGFRSFLVQPLNMWPN